MLYYSFIDDTLHSFKKLKALISFVDVSIIYHGGLISDLGSLIDAHEKRIIEIKKIIFFKVMSISFIIRKTNCKDNARNNISYDIASYMLTKGLVQAYIAELVRENLVEIKVINGFIH